MFEAVQALAKEENTTVILFGGRGNEAAELEKWQKELPGTFVAAGKLSLSQELDLISHLQVMLSMDSANMHLASLVGTRAVSVWGATHPYSGFLGYGPIAGRYGKPRSGLPSLFHFRESPLLQRHL